MQIKTTIRYYFTPVRRAKKNLQTINAGEGVEKREPSYTVCGNVNWYNHYGEQYGGSLNIELLYDHNPTPEHISRENHSLKRYMLPNVHWSTVFNSQDIEATYMSTDRGVDKEDVVHIYNGILLSHKKEQHNAICSNMNGPRDSHTEWSKTYRERQISYDIAYMWNLKNNGTDELIYKREIKSQMWKTNLRLPGGKGINWEIGIDIETLLYMK